MKTHNQGDMPFGTSNAALAFARYIAGVPFASDEQPLVHIYDAQILKGLGYAGPVEQAAAQAFGEKRRGHVEYGFKLCNELGLTSKAFDAQQAALLKSAQPAAEIIAEIKDRHAAGRLALCEALTMIACVVVKRWRDEAKEWAKLPEFGTQMREIDARDFDARELAELRLLAGNVPALIAVLLRAREAFLSLAWQYSYQIRLHRGGQPTREGPRGKSSHGHHFPGFVAYGPGAENDVRKDLGVATR